VGPISLVTLHATPVVLVAHGKHELFSTPTTTVLFHLSSLSPSTLLRYVEMDKESANETLGVECTNTDNWVTCEMPMGSVLFLNNLIPHRSLNNVSQDTRWSIDFR